MQENARKAQIMSRNKSWATAAELRELFPQKFGSKQNGYIHGSMEYQVKHGGIRRKLDQVQVRSRHGSQTATVWVYSIPDIRRWLKSPIQIRNGRKS